MKKGGHNWSWLAHTSFRWEKGRLIKLEALFALVPTVEITEVFVPQYPVPGMLYRLARAFDWYPAGLFQLAFGKQ